MELAIVILQNLHLRQSPNVNLEQSVTARLPGEMIKHSTLRVHAKNYHHILILYLHAEVMLCDQFFLHLAIGLLQHRASRRSLFACPLPIKGVRILQ